ncbi:hypothetical protein [Halobacteriovorax sp.]|uniref:hypothetical protein n=1 Tax=Halobacteriovorax sp. TaxID=2020862 RepID=UPI0035641821
MKTILIALILTVSTHTYALNERNLDFSQSSSGISWKSIDNNYVKLIFPDYLGRDSFYIANLLDYYSNVVGKTYDIDSPEKHTLIIRPEAANPNGYVTLAPRRSEWFSSSSFSTLLGSSEWYQTLAIHEYRHIVQYDHFNRGFTKFVSALFGDTGQSAMSAIGLEAWYFEGDAVWAETKYTDAGRGRSPLFLSRLKAMLTSGQVPTYDELLNGSYNTQLPGHYEFGYVLISNATKRFGSDFWKKVVRKISSFPHPYRLYTAFKEVSGVSFYDFFDQTMLSLQKEWSQNKKLVSKRIDFRENTSPFKVGNSIFYLHDSLDDYWSIYKKEKNKKVKVIEIPFSKGLSAIDIKGKHAVYNQFLPHSRYGHKGSSDLVLINLSTGKQERITSGKRIYNPRINESENKILATEFTEKLKWNLSEFDLKGNRTKTYSIKNADISEAYPIGKNEVVILVSNLSGHKSIKKLNLSTGKSISLLPASRNNIHSLYVNKNKDIFFEAQYKGVTDIFKISKSRQLSKCTNAKINALTPYADNNNLYYSNQDGYGSHISRVSLNKCQRFKTKDLIDFNYLGNNPSDNYNYFSPSIFKDQKKIRNKSPKKYSVEDYGHIDKRLFIPHSWSFFVGNGFGVNLETSNYLRTLGLGIQFGQDAAENQNYSEFNFDIKGFYPLINLNIGQRSREVDFFNSDLTLEWEEKSTGATITLPYTYKKNLYTFTNLLSFNASLVNTTDYNSQVASNAFSARDFTTSSIELYTKLSKDLTERSIISPWEFIYYGIYENAKGENATDSSYRVFHSSQINIPGVFANDGLYFTYAQEKQKDTIQSYKFLPIQLNTVGSVFSRGYDYESTPFYNKITANYTFPLLTPDFDIWGIYYLRRAFANLFIDSTKLESRFKNSTYNSSGIEIELESVLFRKLPINFGTRYIYKYLNEETLTEYFINTSLSF